jgi:hypothetical protein
VRISFDLDDTLICYGDGVASEPRLPWYRRLFVDDEPIRLGAPALMRALQERGWEVCIYTTSQRSPAAVRRWLRRHGVSVLSVISHGTDGARLRPPSQRRVPSKNPAALRIDLHVDDSEGVRQEGEEHGFRVVVVTPDDDQWVEKVLLAASQVQAELGKNDET